MSKAESQLVVLKPLSVKGKEVPRYALKDVWFYFLNTMPQLNKGKREDASFPMKNRTFSVSVLADRKTAVAFKKKFTDCKIETVDAEEFEEKFKCEPPFEAETYSIIKLARHASYPDGSFFLGAHGLDVFVLEGRKPVGVAMKKIKAKPHADHEERKDYDGIVPNLAIGNGSFGTIICEEYTYTFEGAQKTKPIHQQVYISDLVAYEGGSSVDRGLEADELSELGFDEPVQSGEIIEEEAKGASTEKSSNKPANDADNDDDGDDDNDIPEYGDDDDGDDDDDVPFKTE
ncbi:hypothetical protein LINGLNFE_00035 [Enterobacter phage phi63_307]|uniref:Uncharacterized protein n=1 Tax=Enterobacter phage phi63_307 TaxID=2340711 RepID=A0A386K5H5_9CAUD|nr:hypothetical protein LINGLNFE_00035 [Enterobacter phage phi63_307]